MQTHYVFVDYENTQPGNIGLISEYQQNIQIKIYLGRHQNMIPLSLARAMHGLGERAEYIQLESSRRNAIDFNIAFQLGELAIQHPESKFSILSNDPGFDAILESLKTKGIICARYPDIETLLEHTTDPAPSDPGKSGQDKVVAMDKKPPHVQAVR